MKQPRSYYGYVVVDKRLPVDHQDRVKFADLSRQVCKQQCPAYARNKEERVFFRVRRVSMRIFES